LSPENHFGRRKGSAVPPKDTVSEDHASAPQDADSALRDAINCMQEAFALFDADDRLVFCNDAYTQIHPLGKTLIRPGILFEDIIRTNVENGNVADAFGREEEYILERLELHRNPKGPIYRRLANGSSFIINESRTPDGHTLFTSTEVTELKQIEEALRESEQRLNDAVESIADGVALFDAADNFVFCNTAFRENLGNLDDVLVPGTPLEDIVRAAGERNLFKGDRDGLEKYVRQRMAEHSERKPVVHHYPDTDSSVLIQEYKTSDGGTFIVRTDITELKRAEEALRSSENRLRGAIDSLQEGFAFYDAGDRLVLFNDEFRRLHPNLNDVIKPGMAFEDLIRAHTERGMNADAIGREEDHIRERMEQHRNPKGTITRTLTDGTSYIIKESRTPDGGTAVTEADNTEHRRAEIALRESEERHRDLIHGSVMGIVIDRDGKPIFANQAYADLFGYDGPDDILALNKLDVLYAPGDLSKIKKFRKARLKGAAAPDLYEFEGVRKDGSKILLESRFRVVTWDGTPATQSTLIDITERKEAEEALRANETLLRTIMDNADVEITLKDVNRRFLLANRKFQENHGLGQDQFTGKTLAELYSPEEVAHFDAMERKVLETGETLSQELQPIGMAADKTFFTTKFPIRNDEGRIVSIGTVNIDITDLKEAEIALTESEARFRDIAEAASDYFWETGPDLRYTFVSERFYEKSNLTPENIIGKTRKEFAGPEAIKENPELWKAHEEDLKNRRPFRNFEYSQKLPDGQVHYRSVSGRPFFGRDGTFMGYRGASTDITDYRRAQMDLTHHNKMESLGHLAGGMAHNLNNLLQPILILGQMTKDSLEEGSREHQNLEVICRAGGSAKELVERISAFSRQQGLNRESLEMFAIVREGLSLIDSTVPASITLKQDLDRSTGRVLVDKAQIQTVLMNLVANAVDAMKGRTGVLSISLAPATIDDSAALSIPGLGNGEYAKLTIADTGPGIDDETLNRIFDPFFTTKGIGMGTGLGLSSAFGIIQKHGGSIRALSEPGAGAAFEVYLPLEQSVKT